MLVGPGLVVVEVIVVVGPVLVTVVVGPGLVVVTVDVCVIAA